MTTRSLQCKFIKQNRNYSHATLNALVEWAACYSLVDCIKTMIQHVVKMKTHRSQAKYFRNYLYLLSTSSEDKWLGDDC